MKASVFSDPVFQNFVSARPVAVATQLIARRILDSNLIDQLFRDNAAMQYEQSLLFSSLSHLMLGVTLGKYKSVNAGYKKMSDQLGVSITSIYNKLQRIEPQTSRAFVKYSYEATVAIQREIGSIPRNAISGYALRILDGNHLSGTEHRIKETRALRAAPLPGKSLVVFDPRYECICDFFPIEDGHAQERSALDDVIESLDKKQLWIADRNFCTLKFMYRMASAGSCFLIRHHRNLEGTEKGKLRRIGKTETAEIFENELVLPSYDGEELTVRRIVCRLFKPTDSGETEIILFSNVPKSDADAIELSHQYIGRWKIEIVFNHITLNLNCEIQTLGYPPAALFCFSLSLIAYNCLGILKSLVAKVHGREDANNLSHHYLVSEIASTTDGLLVAFPEDKWVGIDRLPIAKFLSQLSSVIERMDMRLYRKSIRGPKNPPPKKTGGKRDTHVSTKRLIENRQ
jgi:IS4 transposase